MNPALTIRRAAVLAVWLAAAACASTPASSASAAAPAVEAAPPPAGAPAKPNSLYRQLGGYDQLAAIRDNFLGRMVKDSTLGPFFAGLTPAELDRIRQMVVDQLCAATGGPCVYVGRSMKEAHKNLTITYSDWQQAMKLFNLTLDDFGVSRSARNELLAIMRTVEPQIVKVP